MILILFSIHAAFSAKTASLRACSSHFTAIEDTADVYGVQIVFNVMRKMLGTEIVKIVFPELAMTHRELFYHTLAAGLCTSDFAAQWRFDADAKRDHDTHNGSCEWNARAVARFQANIRML
ncbi:hypothetical protein PENTCL1PPCAC_25008 [Pristionchus entomophagus]|uniref:Uncharacterized protein n=1 Tax=Pristionchus entomophagus TaxID=358040 RepID=A0AAV5U8W7_9BILA|nr:hypothetical protein PENTCL1PPCAC_25008 [Pristionchus entomophagus]